MKMIHAFGCSLLLVTVAFAQRSAQGAQALVGTWRLVEFADLDKNGKWQYWYGEHPRGYFVYDTTGHVHVQIMKVPPLARFPEANWDIDKPPATAKAAVDEAHRHGMPVFAHPTNVEGVRVAIDSGVDVLAHTLPQSPPWTPDFTQQLKYANLSLIPTLTLFDVEGHKANVPDQQRTAWIAQMVDQLRAYSYAGGDILFGTDIGYTDHYDTMLEFTLMSQAGMNHKQILASLTTNPARKFGDSDRTGRIAKDMKADLVILSADPAEDITAYSKVRFTIRKGEVVYKER